MKPRKRRLTGPSRYRLKKGWTQDRLAEAAGVTRQTVSNVERGLPAQVGTIRALAGALGVPIGRYFETFEDIARLG